MLSDAERILKVVQMARENTALAHSAKGTTWKNHKYTKKVGDRYYYGDETEKEDDELFDLDDIVETPDFEKLAVDMDNVRPEPIRKFNETVIWSPDKNKETLVSKGKDAIDNLFKKNKKRAMAKK